METKQKHNYKNKVKMKNSKNKIIYSKRMSIKLSQIPTLPPDDLKKKKIKKR